MVSISIVYLYRSNVYFISYNEVAMDLEAIVVYIIMGITAATLLTQVWLIVYYLSKIAAGVL